MATVIIPEPFLWLVTTWLVMSCGRLVVDFWLKYHVNLRSEEMARNVVVHRVGAQLTEGNAAPGKYEIRWKS